MEKIGIDVHKVASQLCIRTDEGAFIEQRIATTREAFAKYLGGRARARVLVEASTESEWVARCLDGLGHEVIVADPNVAPMSAKKRRARGARLGEPIDRWRHPPTEPHHAPRSIDRSLKTLDRGRRFTEGITTGLFARAGRHNVRSRTFDGPALLFATAAGGSGTRANRAFRAASRSSPSSRVRPAKPRSR